MVESFNQSLPIRNINDMLIAIRPMIPLFAERLHHGKAVGGICMAYSGSYGIVMEKRLRRLGGI